MSLSSSESREDYLESILILKKKNGAVRSIDIANYFDYSRPSISRAVGLLRNEKLITVDDSGYIELTPTGQKMADGIYGRHKVLVKLFEKLGVSPDTAVDDACRVEHVLSEETMQRIREFLDA